jgi:hypothetical protein
MATQTLSKQTQKNWLIDLALFGSAIVAILSGIYFLFVPSGGFQGGRNRFYNLQILFDRHTWDNLHTWGGIAMIAAAVFHLIIHWPWVVGMARRIWNELSGQGSGMNANGRYNLILNATVAISFLITAISGVYFLFVPGGRGAIDPLFLFTRTTWDLIHTWAGVVMTIAAILHFAIHWKWVTKVTLKMVRLFIPFQPVEHSVSGVKA